MSVHLWYGVSSIWVARIYIKIIIIILIHKYSTTLTGNNKKYDLSIDSTPSTPRWICWPQSFITPLLDISPPVVNYLQKTRSAYCCAGCSYSFKNEFVEIYRYIYIYICVMINKIFYQYEIIICIIYIISKILIRVLWHQLDSLPLILNVQVTEWKKKSIIIFNPANLH